MLNKANKPAKSKTKQMRKFKRLNNNFNLHKMSKVKPTTKKVCINLLVNLNGREFANCTACEVKDKSDLVKRKDNHPGEAVMGAGVHNRSKVSGKRERREREC